MGTRASAFVEPSTKWTLHFDLAPPVRPTTTRELAPRIRTGIALSITVVAAAAVISVATWPRSTGAVAQAAPAPVAAPAPTEAAAPAAPAATTPAAVPVPVLTPDVYARAALTCPGLPSSVLAAIHEVETRRATDGAHVSAAGARGPMQFLPETWRAYRVDGDGDGHADINDPDDAVFTAASQLCANGASDPAGLRVALWNYNHSWSYVDRVVRLAGGAGQSGE